jgi:hypothetical protein
MAVEAADDQEIFEQVKAPLRSAATLAGMGISNAASSSTADAVNRRNRDVRQIAEVRSREQAMLDASKANLEPVFDADWVDRASTREVAARYQEAMAWQGRDPRLDEAAAHIRDVVRDRYGVDIATLDRETLEQAITHGEIDHGDAVQAGLQEDNERDAAGNLMNQADQLDAQSAESDDPQTSQDLSEAAEEMGEEGVVAFDSAERLQHEAQRLTKAALDDHQVEDAMRIEISHAQPVNETVRASKPVSKKKGKAKGFSKGRIRTRGAGLGR